MNADAVDVAAEILGPRATRDRSLAPFSTYKVGGPAALDVVVEDVEDLRLLGRVVQETGLDVLVVGKGSNLLVADAGFPGIAVRLGEPYEEVVIDGEVVHAGAATLLPVVARRTAAAGLTGFEWAVGVPGSMGGAVRMNAGGHGSDMAATLLGVRVFDLRKGEDGDVSAAELDLGYRSSAIGPHQVVTDATLRLRRGDPEAGKALISEIVAWRREHQPGGQNAGSVFTNPPDDSAGRLVDLAGCKGLRRGTAAVSDKHANFIQADPGGSADDVFRVMVAVRDAVEERTGVRLHPETVLVGFDREVFS